MLRAALLVSVASAAGCGPGECGTYAFSLPETTAYYADMPSLIPPRSAVELCGNDFGTQGSWDTTPGQSVISFEPDDGEVGTFSDMLLTVTFATPAALDGATIEVGPELAGLAFTGLSFAHHDTATLTSGSLTFHRVGDLLVEDVFDRRVLDLSWDLQWGNGYDASGRDSIDMYVDKQ